MTFSSPPGVFDIVPNDSKETWRSSYLWQYLEAAIRKIAAQYGFQEIRTPILERTELFQRGVGETSDIVSKEMYSFEDKGGRLLSLRPEGTAPVMRAIIEHQLFQTSSIQKLFYICPMFRYERPQAGRYRQHHQMGFEVIGNAAPEQDVEVIDLIYTLYCRLGLKNLQVNINSIGDVESRLNYRKALQDFLQQSFEHLSPESQSRLQTNPLRILDSKDPNDNQITENAPSILNFLNEESRDHFEQIKILMQTLKIPFKVDAKLVRGLDYYNKTVFEITSGELGAQNSVAGGGRYDGLLKTLGGPDLPAFGFGCGLERLLQTLLKQNVSLPEPYRPYIFIISLGTQAKSACFQLLHEIRQHAIHAEMDFSQRKLNKIMQHADSIRAKYVTIIGDNELETQLIELKEMESGEKKKIALSNLLSFLISDSSSVQNHEPVIN